MKLQSYEITVDTQKSINHSNIEFSQNNLNISELIFNITEDEKEFPLNDTDKIIVYFKKPDKTVVFQDKEIELLDKAKGKIKVLLTSQTLVKSGEVNGEISIERVEKGTKKRVSTYGFSFKVRSSIASNDSIESTNEFQVFDKILETGEVLKGVNVPALIESEKVATEAKEATFQLSNKVEVLSGNKADKSYVDEKVSSIASGSPKAVYATLNDLNTAKPTGDSNVYVVSADGKWYYWNKMMWTAGGVYQSTSIGDRSVSKVKLSSDLSAKIDEIDEMKYDMFLGSSDNKNFGLLTISDADWYKPESSFIDPCTNDYLIGLGVKNWVHLDTDEFNNLTSGKGYRDIFYKLKYENSISGKYFQTIFYLYSETGVISDFKLTDTFVSTGTGFAIVTPTEVSAQLVPGYTNLWKVRKSGLIPSGGHKEIWIGSSFGSDALPKAPDMSVGGFYGKVFNTKQDGKDGFITAKPNIPGPIKQNTEDISQLQKDIKHKWNGKRIVGHGDSIMWYDGNKYPDGTTSVGYLTNMNKKIGFSSMLNKGVSGACIAQNQDEYADICDVVKTVDYTLYDIVIIAGGTNDFGRAVPLGVLGNSSTTTFDRTTFYGAYREIVEYILSKNPTIQIVLFTPLKRKNFDNKNGASCVLGDYAKAINNIGELYSLPVIDLYSLSGVNKNTLSTYTIDDLHLNNPGYERVTKNIIVPFLETV
ncbi:GDSL-type esterase/lipase family protein [Bacillus mycoides]|uniref:GDSL-type esterase/lipase family protein n=1 Tax=Bacillus mycoides TaxID=1405 RepID=UPI003F74BA93